MAKAGAVQITPEAKYDGMVAAWTGGNIGEISNQITRIWASPDPDLDAVKILVMENNFVIDYAKTLYKPTRPPEWEARIRAATTGRVPRFFIYAKDKTPKQCEPSNSSVVNRLFDKVQSYKFDFKKKQLGKFDYKKLMHDPDVAMDDRANEVVKHYLTLVRRIGDYNIGISDDRNRYIEIIKDIKWALSQFGDETYVTDVLVKYLFGIKKSIHKAVLWEAYGHVIYRNLLDNHAGEQRMCPRCGARFTPMHPNQFLCPSCGKEGRWIPPVVPKVYCTDCGKLFQPDDLHQTRCPVCQWIRDNPVAVDHDFSEAICVECGAPFSVRKRGRGKRSKLCPRCQKLSARRRNRDNMRRKRAS